MKAGQKEIKWYLVLWWVLATFIGWGLMPFLAIYIWLPSLTALFLTFTGESDVFRPFPMEVGGVYLGVLFGITIGVLQWLVLRRHINQAYLWISVTVGGLALGMPLGIIALLQVYTGSWVDGPFYFILIAGIAPGIIVGLLQLLVLRRHFNRSWWWMVPSALTWPISLVYLLPEGGYIFPAIWGLAAGIVSGITFFLISRSSRKGVIKPVIGTASDRPIAQSS